MVHHACMMLRLNPQIPVVWRDPYCMQLGVDIPVCTLPGATTATQRMLAALAVGVPRPALTVIGTEAGASISDVAALLDAVRPALLPDPQPSAARPVIAVDGDGASLPLLRDLLVRSGMHVVPAAHAQHETVDAAVIVASFAIPPAQHGEWLRRDIPHLPVVFGDRLVRIGPFVEPGFGPCAHCVDLERVDADPAWPAMATQLAGRSAAAQQPLACADAAARVVRMVTARVVHGSRSNAMRSFTLDAETGVVTERLHRPHERCACRALPGNVTPLALQPAPSPVGPSSIASGGARA